MICRDCIHFKDSITTDAFRDLMGECRSEQSPHYRHYRYGTNRSCPAYCERSDMAVVFKKVPTPDGAEEPPVTNIA